MQLVIILYIYSIYFNDYFKKGFRLERAICDIELDLLREMYDLGIIIPIKIYWYMYLF